MIYSDIPVCIDIHVWLFCQHILAFHKLLQMSVYVDITDV